MTLGNMRANGVRRLAAWCGARECGHRAVVDVEPFPDDTPVSSDNPAVVKQIIDLERELANAETNIKIQELEMNKAVYALYDLSDSEIDLIERE